VSARKASALAEVLKRCTATSEADWSLVGGCWSHLNEQHSVRILYVNQRFYVCDNVSNGNPPDYLVTGCKKKTALDAFKFIFHTDNEAFLRLPLKKPWP
jgi:hypothetical protein